MASIQGIYIALFGRPADPEGLQFWTAQTKGGTDLSFLIGRLTAADEYQDRVDDLSPTQLINAIYQQLYGRDADASGLAHYLALLASGEQSIETIAINILDGTTGTDLLTLDAKIDAANLFTASLDTQAEIDAYNGAAAEAAGRDFLDDVNVDNQPSQADVDAAVRAIQDPEEVEQPAPPTPGPGGGGPVLPPAEPPHEVEHSVGSVPLTSTENSEGKELWAGDGILIDNKIVAVDSTAGVVLALGANYRTGNQLVGTQAEDGDNFITINAVSGHQKNGQFDAYLDRTDRSAVSFDFTIDTGELRPDETGQDYYLRIDIDPTEGVNFRDILFSNADFDPDLWIGYDVTDGGRVIVIGDEVPAEGVIQDSVNFGFSFLSQFIDGVDPAASGDIPAGNYEVWLEARDKVTGNVDASVGIVFELYDETVQTLGATSVADFAYA